MPTETDSVTAAAPVDHLCVLVHGLWGNPEHLWYLAQELRAKSPNVHVLVAKRNAGSFTYDGIELGGERVTSEIEECLEELARKGHQIKKISITGYSLGGLVSRYAIGLLHHKGWFDKLEPVNFTTFASPHLGVRTPHLGFGNHIWNVLGARLLSMSGRQLFMIDTFRDTGRPLLSLLAEPDSIFMQGLASFKKRSLYANVVNDRSVVFYTASISKINPYVDLDSVKITYLKGYEPIILDPDCPVSSKEDEVPFTLSQRLTSNTQTVIKAVPFIAFLMVFLPIGSTLFMLNSAVQSVRSRQRIRLHEEGKAGIAIGGYRVPVMLSRMQQRAEDMFENVHHTQGQDYLPENSEEVSSPKASASLDVKEKSDSSLTSFSESNVASERRMEFPTLALTPEQFAMVQSLNHVGFAKYHVYIHGERHSHASIIVRKKWPLTDDGKVVVGHWVSGFEL